MANKRRPAEDEEGGDPAPLTRDDVVDIVNAAVSGHVQRKLPNMVKDAISGPIGELRALIEGGRSGRSDPDEDDPDDDAPARRQPSGRRQSARDRDEQPARRRAADDDQDRDRDRQDRPDRRAQGSSETRALQARLNNLEAERARERQEARSRQRDDQLRDLLTEAGVDKLRLRGAVAVLRESTKFDEKAGEWLYTAKRDGVDEDGDLASGVREWSATDEGKSYLAPPASAGRVQPIRSGSGTRPAAAGAARVGAGTQPAAGAREAKAAAKAEAVANLTGAFDALAGGGGVTLG